MPEPVRDSFESVSACSPMSRKKVLFLCTHNSARSQMAEGLTRHLAGDRFEAFSAGTETTRVRSEATEAMREIGADISGQTSETLDRYLKEDFDLVVTVCDGANETCPVRRLGGPTGDLQVDQRGSSGPYRAGLDLP